MARPPRTQQSSASAGSHSPSPIPPKPRWQRSWRKTELHFGFSRLGCYPRPGGAKVGRSTSAKLLQRGRGHVLLGQSDFPRADRVNGSSFGSRAIHGEGGTFPLHRDEPREGVEGKERRRNVLLLRWLSIITTSYLLLLSPGGSGQPLVVVSTLLLVASNGVLHALPG